MAIEKSWTVVAPQPFTADGTTLGEVRLASTAGFKVKQTVGIQSSAQPPIAVQVKRVVSPTLLIVGPLAESLQPPQRQQGNQLLSVRSDISAYLVADGAFIYAAEQPKANLKPDDIWQAVYDQEPAVALRTTQVDQFGNYWTPANPFPVAIEGTISIGQVEILGSPSGDLLNVNADGSINVNIVSAPISGQVEKNIYNEVLAVASGVETQIASYTVPLGKTAILQRITTSGENVGRYRVYLNSVPFDTQRTYYGGDMNSNFEYTTGTSNGYILNASDVIAVKILHTRVYVGNFNARIQVLEIT
jgi:hypothetical protein